MDVAVERVCAHAHTRSQVSCRAAAAEPRVRTRDSGLRPQRPAAPPTPRARYRCARVPVAIPSQCAAVMGLALGVAIGYAWCGVMAPATGGHGVLRSRIVSGPQPLPHWPRFLHNPNKVHEPMGAAVHPLTRYNESSRRSHADVRQRYESFFNCLLPAARGSSRFPLTVRSLLAYNHINERAVLRAHAEEVYAATAIMRGMPYHSYGGYGGPWVENWFIEGLGERLDFDAWEPAVPLFIQWTDAWIRAGATSGMAHVLSTRLAKLLRPDVIYVTVVQYMDGLYPFAEKFPGVPSDNIIVFSAGGNGNVPLPLLKGAQNVAAVATRPYSERSATQVLASFAGSLYPGLRANLSILLASMNGSSTVLVNPDGVRISQPSGPAAHASVPLTLLAHQASLKRLPAAFRSQNLFARRGGAAEERAAAEDRKKREEEIAKTLAHMNREVHLPGAHNLSTRALVGRLFEYKGPQWRAFMEASLFQFAPRGTGRTSFRLYEALQMGLIPIYVWDDYEWLPFTRLPRTADSQRPRFPNMRDVAWLSGRTSTSDDQCLLQHTTAALHMALNATALAAALQRSVAVCCESVRVECAVLRPIVAQILDIALLANSSRCADPSANPDRLLNGALLSVQLGEVPALLRLLPDLERRHDLLECMRQRIFMLRESFLNFASIAMSVFAFVNDPPAQPTHADVERGGPPKLYCVPRPRRPTG